MRDKRKSAEYFSTYIRYEKDRIEKRLDKLRDCTDAAKTVRISENLFRSQLNLLISSFSAGADRDELNEIYGAMCKTAENVHTLTYWEALVLGTFAVMMDSADAVKPVLDKFEQIFVSDKLLNGLASFLQNGKAEWVGTYQFAEPYAKLDAVLAAPTAARAEQALKEYLYLWYSQCADYAWYNTVNNTNDVYYGYWCFEAAALVRILGLNEDALAIREYYPKL